MYYLYENSFLYQPLLFTYFKLLWATTPGNDHLKISVEKRAINFWLKLNIAKQLQISHAEEAR